jgi:hypothetical protein
LDQNPSIAPYTILFIRYLSDKKKYWMSSYEKILCGILKMYFKIHTLINQPLKPYIYIYIYILFKKWFLSLKTHKNTIKNISIKTVM